MTDHEHAVPGADSDGLVPTVLVDDTRRFADGRDGLVFRTSRDAVAGLRAIARRGSAVRDLWLDYDLGGGDTVLPVLDLLAQLDRAGQRLRVDRVHIITSSATGGHAIRQALDRLRYPCERHHGLRGLLTAR